MDEKRDDRRRDGITAAILHDGKVLLLKRRNVPFITNPNTWALLSGAREKGESYLETAYREIEEEVKLNKNSLKLLKDLGILTIYPQNNPTFHWKNNVFIFESNTDEIKINYEHSDYRWAEFGELQEHREYTRVFIEEEVLFEALKHYLNR